MTVITQLDVVRVTALRKESRAFSGTHQVARQPRVGDIGTVVHAYDATEFVVECIDAMGMTIWLADFNVSEVELA